MTSDQVDEAVRNGTSEGVVKTMTMEEIIRGETKTVEFKKTLPSHSERYMKTVIAYANTQGGRIVFGVADETRTVVGIGEDILFQTMDSIANAISDACEPQIIPEIELCSIDGKTVIVVTVLPGTRRDGRSFG